MNAILSLEMCFFTIINADGLDVKGFCKHSSLKNVFSALFMRHPSMHNSVQERVEMFCYHVPGIIYHSGENNFPGQIIPPLIIQMDFPSASLMSC